MRFDDSAPRRREDREQPAAFPAAAAAELDSTGLDDLHAVDAVPLELVMEAPR